MLDVRSLKRKMSVEERFAPSGRAVLSTNNTIIFVVGLVICCVGAALVSPALAGGALAITLFCRLMAPRQPSSRYGLSSRAQQDSQDRDWVKEAEEARRFDPSGSHPSSIYYGT